MGALQAVTGGASSIPDLQFRDALNYTGEANMPEDKRTRFNQAMQYVDVPHSEDVALDSYAAAAERCSLVHALYLVVAETDSYEGLSKMALASGGFEDMAVGNPNASNSWCIRVRHYGAVSGEKKERRHGVRTRSVSMERRALKDLTPLLLTFGGNVDLKHPDCKIYVFDGLENDRKVLARRLAVSPRTSIIAPSTRLCVTNTPLCPIAAFSLCNVAGIREGGSILDPYGGSCAILMAAAMIAPTSRTVAIEISHNGLVNRDDIIRDFSSRNLTQPLALIQGDSTNLTIRDGAREAILGEAFDHIVTDPPYGIRESMSYNSLTPIRELLRSISNDRSLGKRLLKLGGKLVCFIPCSVDEVLEEVLPTAKELDEAGLVLLDMREQPLNDKLSRWLVSFECIR
jgi:tRNA G10  N-methylase Trm11